MLGVLKGGSQITDETHNTGFYDDSRDEEEEEEEDVK
jgi:hypothetical protein